MSAAPLNTSPDNIFVFVHGSGRWKAVLLDNEQYFCIRSCPAAATVGLIGLCLSEGPTKREPRQ